MALFRKIKKYLYRKIVTEHDVMEFAKEFSYAQSELSLLIKDDLNLHNLTSQIRGEVVNHLNELIPSAKSTFFTDKNSNVSDLMCIRCFATRTDGYLVYGCQIWVRLKGVWKYYNYGTDKWLDCLTFPPDDFSVTCCGCCGDVNTFCTFQELHDYYFVY